MRIALVSHHFYNVTAAGQSTAKVARALTDAGERVTVFTGVENWLEGDRLEPEDGPLAGIAIERIAPEPEAVPRWWRALDARRHRLATLPNLAWGCSVRDHAWVLAASARLRRAIAGGARFDLLLTRLNHVTSHLVGLRAKRRHPDLPWCAYFSDPWPFHHYPPPYASTAGRLSRRRLDRRLDAFLTRADSYVFPSARQRDHELEGARARFRGRAAVAPHLGNVWHPPPRPKAREAVLRLRHAGFLMRERKVEPLFDAVRALLARRPEARDVLRLEFIGRYADGAVPAPPADLEGVVAFHRFRRPDEIWEWLQAADVLLLVEADLEHGIFFPSKLADYLGAERPILALSPRRGVAADLLAPDDGSGGAVADLLAPPADGAAIGRALECALDAWRDDRLEDMLPGPEARRQVSPEHVVACYRQAFALARAHAGGRR